MNIHRFDITLGHIMHITTWHITTWTTVTICAMPPHLSLWHPYWSTISFVTGCAGMCFPVCQVALMEGMAFAKSCFAGENTCPDYEFVPSAVFCTPPMATGASGGAHGLVHASV